MKQQNELLPEIDFGEEFKKNRKTVHRFSENGDNVFLFGYCRTYKKNQLDWIWGKKTGVKRYNIRLDHARPGAVNGSDAMSMDVKYVILYDGKTPDLYSVFSVKGCTICSEEEMRDLEYPDPHGSYVVYELDELVPFEIIDLQNVVNFYKNRANGKMATGTPIFATGRAIENIKNSTISSSFKKTHIAGSGLVRLDENVGFNKETLRVVQQSKNLSIALVDADLLDHGTRHPNLVLLKISHYCKQLGHNVHLVEDYSEINYNALFEEDKFDVVVMSRVFKFTSIPSFVENLIQNHYIAYGGTGFFEIHGPELPDVVEHEMPDYQLYVPYIERVTGGDEKKKKKDWDDYLSYSIGFTTRGCIRHCGFCVNRELNAVFKWSPVSEFFDSTRPKIYLWDDNIMAAPPKVFKQVMEDLIASGRSFQFRQGMDIRLINDEKAELLNRVKYYGDYIFAFDHYRMDDENEKRQVVQTLRGLEVWRRHCKKSTKLYVIVGYDYQDERDIEGTFFRIKKLMEFGCLPYIMRFEAYNQSRFKTLYVQIARWCNQPGFFKKMSFRQFCVRNEEYHQGIAEEVKDGKYNSDLKLDLHRPTKEKFCACYQAMVDFEKEFPEIAKEYFDLRFEDVNPYIIQK